MWLPSRREIPIRKYTPYLSTSLPKFWHHFCEQIVACKFAVNYIKRSCPNTQCNLKPHRRTPHLLCRLDEKVPSAPYGGEYDSRAKTVPRIPHPTFCCLLQLSTSTTIWSKKAPLCFWWPCQTLTAHKIDLSTYHIMAPKKIIIDTDPVCLRQLLLL